MPKKRKINYISFDTIAKELKKVDHESKIGLISVKNICNTEEFWSAFLVFFKEYINLAKK